MTVTRVTDDQLDVIDTMVWWETRSARKRYVEACRRLNLRVRELPPVRLGERSVP